jgi:hypothetical protein
MIESPTSILLPLGFRAREIGIRDVNLSKRKVLGRTFQSKIEKKSQIRISL